MRLEIAQPETTITSLVTQVLETWMRVGAGEVYTACDGIPRYRFFESPTASTPGTVSITSTFRMLHLKDRITPTCIPSDEYCKNFLKTFMADRIKSAAVETSNVGSGVKQAIAMGCEVPSRCALVHNAEVQVYYWPPTLPERNLCGPDGYQEGSISIAPNYTVGHTHVTSALTFEGKDMYLKSYGDNGTWQPVNWAEEATTIGPTIIPGPFTFTYPFVYVAHREILRTDRYFALQSTGQIGGANSDTWTTHLVRPPGIFPVRSEDVFSLIRARPEGPTGIAFAHLVGSGLATNALFGQQTDIIQPFNFGHLQNPVPASQFFEARSEDCIAQQTHCATITDDSYRPKLVMRNNIWLSYLPEHFSCGGVPLDDPPKTIVALPYSTIAEASLPQVVDAKPGDSAAGVLSRPTGIALTEDRRPNEESSPQVMDARPGDSAAGILSRPTGVALTEDRKPNEESLAIPASFDSSPSALKVDPSSGNIPGRPAQTSPTKTVADEKGSTEASDGEAKDGVASNTSHQKKSDSHTFRAGRDFWSLSIITIIMSVLDW